MATRLRWILPLKRLSETDGQAHQGNRVCLPQTPSELNTLSLHQIRSTIAMMISTLLGTLISTVASHRKLAVNLRENRRRRA